MMGYVPPNIEEMSAAIEVVKKEYTRKQRAQIVTALELTQKVLSNASQEKDADQKLLGDASVGLWMMLREHIECPDRWWDRYHFFQPEFKEGYLFNTGSRLYSSLSNALQHDKELNPIDPRAKLIHIEKFYNYFFGSSIENASEISQWRQDLEKNGIKADELKAITEKLMRNILNDMPCELMNLLNAIPTDQAIHQKMETLHDTYIDKKTQSQHSHFKIQNKDRKFSAQMAQALTQKLPTDDKDDDLSRAQRIRMGALICIMQSIKKGYWIRSANHSELYKLCSDALNNELKNFPELTEQACLLAFRNYIMSNENLDDIERYGKKHFSKDNQLRFIDVKINKLVRELDEIIEQTSHKLNNKSKWPATNYLGKFGAMVLAAPFFGIGSLLGLTASESNVMVNPKVQSGNALNQLGNAALGLSHNYLGLMAASYIIQSTLIRAFGKACEAGGIMLGYGLFGTAGFAIDLSCKGFKRFCLYHIYLYENYYDPILMKNVDIDFLRTLVNLPDVVLDQQKQQKLNKLAKENVPEEFPELEPQKLKM